MHLDQRACDRARRSRDARFDGRFFIAVTTTRIYCRPICPARAPRDAHVRYFPTAAAAEAAGFRPCLRCRPEAAPGTPAWAGTSSVVARALGLIDAGALDRQAVADLAARLGVTDRHLRRLFLRHLGATPLQVALTRRAQSAKTLLDETSLPCADIAMAAGFGSLRRFNSHMRRTYRRTPTELRALARRRAPAGPGHYRFRLSYRPPLDWDALLQFLQARATPGVEVVDAAGYRRTVAIDGSHGSISVARPEPSGPIVLDVRVADSKLLLTIVERVRRVCDLGADPALIGEHLGGDPLLRAALRRHPGLRVPGAWDGFELAVRAIVGQQISVAAATTMTGRIAARFGTPVAGGELTRLFPTPAQLAGADLERVGLIRARAEAIRTLAARVRDGVVAFAPAGGDPDAVSGPGIGPWTAAYVAMRAFGHPDAFPCGDLVLRRMAGGLSARELDRRAEAWRPWRAYAVVQLWQAAHDRASSMGRTTHATVTDSTRRGGARRAGRAGAGAGA